MLELEPRRARIVRLSQVTPTILGVTLEVDGPFTFVAGQWIDLSVELDGRLRRTGYSLASAPTDLPTIELAIRYTADHAIGQWFHSGARVGDQVSVRGGQGACVYEPAHGDHVVFVAGGIGIAPPLSMIRGGLASSVQWSGHLYASARSPEELAFVSELTTLGTDPRFEVHTTVTREAAGWNGRRGRWSVAEILEHARPTTIFFVVGPKGMIDDFTSGLTAAGRSAESVRFERW